MTNPKLTGIGMTSARTRDRLIARLREQGIANPLVLERIRSVPRHVFMDEALASRAYEDTALPIGHGQTISQPYVVARMTEALLEGVLTLGREVHLEMPEPALVRLFLGTLHVDAANAGTGTEVAGQVDPAAGGGGPDDVVGKVGDPQRQHRRPHQIQGTAS